MSRIGNRILNIPEGVSVIIDKNKVTVKGPKGELTSDFSPKVNIKVEENKLMTTRDEETKEVVSLHGTTNSLINNMIIGVKDGYTKDLEAVGVGYRFQLQGNTLVVSAGYSHPVKVDLPEGIKAEVNNSTELTLSGIEKQKVAEFAANVRKIRQPEPYKGKGIRYKGEYIRRKEGKKAA